MHSPTKENKSTLFVAVKEQTEKRTRFFFPMFISNSMCLLVELLKYKRGFIPILS